MFDQFMDPDLQAILAFLLPAIAALAILVMNLSRGFSVEGTVAMITLAALALYFARDMIALL